MDLEGKRQCVSATKGTNPYGRNGSGGHVLAVSISHEAGRARVVSELNVLWGVRHALENPSAVEVLEASSCAKSDTR